MRRGHVYALAQRRDARGGKVRPRKTNMFWNYTTLIISRVLCATIIFELIIKAH